MSVLANGWADCEVYSDPFHWLATEPGEFFDLATARSLADSFPTEGFVRHDAGHRQIGKTYRNYSRELVKPGSDVSSDLPTSWCELLSDLTGEAYRADVARLLGQQQAGSVEIRLVRHSPGDWLGPHTDREDKLFSHIVYFNTGWRAEFGGCLEVLRGNDAGAVAGRVVPALGASALLAQAPNSWHQVSEVVSSAPRSRMSLLLHGLR